MLTALWPDRWPAVALQTCVDLVESAPADQQAEVKWALPCKTCPESARCLNARRKELGPLLYDREILTSPRTSMSSLFPWELIEPMLNREAACVPWYRKPFSMEHEWVVCSGWDIAWSEKVGGDFMVKFTAAAHKTSGRRIVLDVARWQRLTFDEQMDLIVAEWGKYNDDLVMLEADVTQTIWQQHMAANTAVPVMKSWASGKKDLATGVPGLLIDLENRKWEIPFQPGTLHHDHVQAWVSELEAFGWQDDKLQGVGEHDDTVMAWFHCTVGLKKLLSDEARAATQQHRGVVSGRRI